MLARPGQGGGCLDQCPCTVFVKEFGFNIMHWASQPYEEDLLVDEHEAARLYRPLSNLLLSQVFTDLVPMNQVDNATRKRGLTKQISSG